MSITYGVPPSELEQAFCASDFQRLADYYRVDPWDQRRGDLRVGILTATIAQMFGGKKGARGYTPADFMPFEVKQRPSKAQLVEKFKGMVRKFQAMGGGGNGR